MSDQIEKFATEEYGDMHARDIELTLEQKKINALIDAVEALEKRAEEHEHGQSGKPIPEERRRP